MTDLWHCQDGADLAFTSRGWCADEGPSRAMEEVGKRSYIHERKCALERRSVYLLCLIESVAIIRQKAVAIVQTNEIHALSQSHCLPLAYH